MTAFVDTPGALLARGVCRLLIDAGAAPVTEFALPNGGRVDVIALDAAGVVTVVEVKASLSDFRADGKWPGYLPWCDAFYFAVDAGFPLEALPDDAGVILADAWGGEILRPAAPRPLAPARRRALTLRLARAAATRLRRTLDPGLSGGADAI
ncbi:MAG: DNA repair protein MmcB-related protein [Rhodobacteraceae bacterium]|nr:MAG: DNA repair protein MmcB-related protein [Paracoccaceae bacterium]